MCVLRFLLCVRFVRDTFLVKGIPLIFYILVFCFLRCLRCFVYIASPSHSLLSLLVAFPLIGMPRVFGRER